MAEKSFGVKKIKLDGNGTPHIESPSGGNLDITAATTTFSGNITLSSGTLTGNGSGLTHLDLGNANNTGTIAAARLDTATTQTAGNNTTKIATTAYTDTAISNLVASSPDALNTLNELAAALGDDANFSTTITNSIATKLANIVEDTSPQLGGNLDTNTKNITFGDSTIPASGTGDSGTFGTDDTLQFGAGNDLSIFHGDGGIYEDMSIIKTQGDNPDLIIEIGSTSSATFAINNRHATGENQELSFRRMISGVGDGSIKLFYSGIEKFKTLTGGVNVTGNTETDTLTVSGATALNGGLTMDTDKFTVADTTGNTTIAGTLAVTGTSTLTGNVTVVNDLGIGDGLAVLGTAAILGNTTIGGLLNADGGIACDTDKFTVADATGNTAIAGTLNVTGTSTFTDINLSDPNPTITLYESDSSSGWENYGFIKVDSSTFTFISKNGQGYGDFDFVSRKQPSGGSDQDTSRFYISGDGNIGIGADSDADFPDSAWNSSWGPRVAIIDTRSGTTSSDPTANLHKNLYACLGMDHTNGYISFGANMWKDNSTGNDNSGHNNNAGWSKADMENPGAAVVFRGVRTGNADQNERGEIEFWLGSQSSGSSWTKSKYVTIDSNGLEVNDGKFSGDGSGLTGLTASQIPTLNQNTTGSSGSCTGNAATATTLETARTIGGTSFDGSANITPGVSGGLTGTPDITVDDITANDGTFSGKLETSSYLSLVNGGQFMGLKCNTSGQLEIVKNNVNTVAITIDDDGGDLDIGDGVSVDGNVYPKTDSQYDLGTNSVRWQNGYFDTLYGDGSNLTGISASGTTINTNADNRIITGSGTANTLNGESNLTFDGSTLIVTGDIRNTSAARDDFLYGNGDVEYDAKGLHLEGLGNDRKGWMSLVTNSNDSSTIGAGEEGSVLLFGRTGTSSAVGTASIITNDYNIGVINFSGGDGDDLRTVAEIRCQEDGGTPATNRVGGKLMFYTTPNSTNGTPTERLRITNSGRVGMAMVGSIDPGDSHLLIRGASTVGTYKGHIRLTGNSTTNGEGPQIVFSNTTGSSLAGAYVGFTKTSGNSQGDLVFGTRGAYGAAISAPVERFRITNSGAICFGDTDDSADGYGTSGQVLMSNGDAPPTWQDSGSSTGTGALQISKGTTAQRPASPEDGMIRYNTSTDVIEEYRSSNWHVLSHKTIVSSTNSTITTSGGYTIHTFTTSGTFTISDQSLQVDYLVVAGGGGGGQKRAGGGGAGGMITASNTTFAAGTYNITVGAGGNGGTGTSSWMQGGDGSNSIISSIATAIGGGGGAKEQTVGSDGGSGGGGSDGQNGGSGTTGQGNAGGNSSSTSGGGGGGGKGGVGNGGGNAAAGSSPYDGGDGGTGGSSSITGTSVTYAGGGGGGARHGDATGGAGAAGGGNGGKDCSNTGTAATVNTGSGGGGGGRDSDSDPATCFYGGNGGSGIVIIRYISTDAEYRY